MLKVPFKAGVFDTAMALAGTALFVALAVWQLDRADQKEALREHFEAQIARPALQYSGGTLDMDEQRYRQAQISGHYLAQGQLLMDNRVHQGQPGYEVLTPLQLEDSGELLLVNRGWVPQGRDRSLLPQLPPPSDTRSLHGRLDLPRSRPVVASDSPRTELPGRWSYLDTTQYREQFGLPIKDFILLLAADEPDGFARDWPLPKANVGMHIGYAIQWAAFALIAIGTYIALGVKRARGNEEAKI